MIDLSNRYDLHELPMPLQTYGGVDLTDPDKAPTPETADAYLWSRLTSPPRIGTRVHVVVNAMGWGTVVSYFVEHGYLGVRVKLETEPEWHAKQCAGTKNAGHCLVFGAELAR